MKKILSLVLVLSVCFSLLGCTMTNSVNDYDTISKLNTVCNTLSRSSTVYNLGDNTATWYMFELGVIYQKDDEIHKKLREELGDDFPIKLSNKDSIFIGFLPYRQTYRIYAGGTSESDMIYPDWNYSKLAPLE